MKRNYILEFAMGRCSKKYGHMIDVEPFPTLSDYKNVRKSQPSLTAAIWI